MAAVALPAMGIATKVETAQEENNGYHRIPSAHPQVNFSAVSWRVGDGVVV